MRCFGRVYREAKRQEQEKKCNSSRMIKLPLCEEHLEHISNEWFLCNSKELLSIIDSNNRVISKIKGWGIDASGMRILSLFEKAFAPLEFEFKRVHEERVFPLVERILGLNFSVAERILGLELWEITRWKKKTIQELKSTQLWINRGDVKCLVSLLKISPKLDKLRVYQPCAPDRIRCIDINFKVKERGGYRDGHEIQKIAYRGNDITIETSTYEKWTYTTRTRVRNIGRDSGEPSPDYYIKEQTEYITEYEDCIYYFDDYFNLKRSEGNISRFGLSPKGIYYGPTPPEPEIKVEEKDIELVEQQASA